MSEQKRKWCATLAKLTAPMNAPQATAAFVAMLCMLPADDRAYNRTTLEYAAKRDFGDPAIPNFDKIAKAFAAWHRENLPAHLRLGGSMSKPPALEPNRVPDDEEIAKVSAIVVALKDEFADRRRKAGIDDDAPRPAYLTPPQLAEQRKRDKVFTAPLRHGAGTEQRAAKAR